MERYTKVEVRTETYATPTVVTPCSNPSTSTGVPVLEEWSTRECSGERIEDFHKRSASGELLPLTRWEQYEVEWKAPRDRCHYKFHSKSSPQCYQEFSNWLISKPASGFPTIETCRQIAGDYDLLADYHLQRAAADIYSRRWDALTFLIELKDVARLWESLCRSLHELARRYHRESWSSWEVFDAPGRWLEWRYGVRPIIFDIEDLTEALTGIHSQIRRLKERSGESVTPPLLVTEGTSDAGGFTYSWVNLAEWKISVRGNVIADVNMPLEIQLNLPVSAWEATRLSFVVDWLWKIGQWLSAMQYLHVVTQDVKAKGFLLEGTGSYELLAATAKTGYSMDHADRYAEWACKYTLRVPSSGITPLPFIHLDLNVAKVLDLLALVVTSFTRR